MSTCKNSVEKVHALKWGSRGWGTLEEMNFMVPPKPRIL